MTTKTITRVGSLELDLLTVNFEYTLYYTPGKFFGPPEACFPDEYEMGECKITSIEISHYADILDINTPELAAYIETAHSQDFTDFFMSN